MKLDPSYEQSALEDEFDLLAANKFHKNGFVVVRSVLDSNFLHSLVLDVDHRIKSDSFLNQKRDIHFMKSGELSSAHNLLEYVPQYKKLQYHPCLRKIAEKIYGGLRDLEFNSSYFAKPAKIGLATKAHQDNAFFCMQPPDIATFWLPIDVANKANGALYYFPKSDSLGNLQHYPQGNLGASMCIDNDTLSLVEDRFEKIYIDLNPGDVVIHNALIVHGSDANESDKSRRAFNFSVAGMRAIRDSQLYSIYQQKLKIFLDEKKKQ